MNQIAPYNTRAAQRRRRKRRRRRLRLLAAGVAVLAAALLLRWVFGGRQPENRGETAGTEEAGDTEIPLEHTGVSWGEDKLSYITSHPELYNQDLIELAQKNQEALDYVYQYPELFGQETEIDLSAEAAGDTVPLLIQWDARWGYYEYGSGLIGYTGCGPTCLSMVALYLTGDADYTPVYVADYAEEHGYYVSGSGTSWTLMSEGCAGLGLSARELPMVESTMISALDAGQPIICNVGPGDFTDTGHYIVLTGYGDGGFTVNDPNSPERSARVWTFDQLNGQVRNLWAFSPSDSVK